jgi:hypothetical protein
MPGQSARPDKKKTQGGRRPRACRPRRRLLRYEEDQWGGGGTTSSFKPKGGGLGLDSGTGGWDRPIETQSHGVSHHLGRARSRPATCWAAHAPAKVGVSPLSPGSSYEELASPVLLLKNNTPPPTTGCSREPSSSFFLSFFFRCVVASPVWPFLFPLQKQAAVGIVECGWRMPRSVGASGGGWLFQEINRPSYASPRRQDSGSRRR